MYAARKLKEAGLSPCCRRSLVKVRGQQQLRISHTEDEGASCEAIAWNAVVSLFATLLARGGGLSLPPQAACHPATGDTAVQSSADQLILAGKGHHAIIGPGPTPTTWPDVRSP